MSNRQQKQTLLGGGKGGGGGALPAAIPAGGGGHGGGGHHGGFHHWGSGPGWRGGPWLWGTPWAVYDVPLPSYGIDLEQLLSASEAEDQKKEDRKALAKEIVKALKNGKAKVGEDLDLLDAEILGEEDKGSDTGKSSGSGGLFGDFGISSIFQTAGNLAQGGLSIYEKEQQKKQAEAQKAKSSAEERGKLQAAISADATAAQAAARAAFSAQQKLPSAQVDASAAAQAAAAQARAGAGLSPETTSQRIEAANRALAAATSKAQAAPKDAYKLALLNAWQQTLNKIQNAQITASPGEGGGADKGSGGSGGSGWLSGKTGPIPNKVVAAGGALGLGALVLHFVRR